MASSIKIRNNIPALNKELLAAFPLGLKMVGQVGEKLITEKIDSNIPPPNAPATIKAKGSSSTLRDTYQMYGQITSEVAEGGKSVKIGIINNEEAATKLLMNEFGTDTIPERSAVRSSLVNDKSNQDKLGEELSKKIKEAIAKSAIR